MIPAGIVAYLFVLAAGFLRLCGIDTGVTPDIVGAATVSLTLWLVIWLGVGSWRNP